jgi:hypothetical protein
MDEPSAINVVFWRALNLCSIPDQRRTAPRCTASGT